MKRMGLILLSLVLLCGIALPVFAQGGEARLVDAAGLLSQNEKQTLLTLLDRISNDRQVDIVAVVVTSLSGKSAQAYADDYYDDHGYGFGEDNSGALLLIADEDGQVSISTCGEMIYAIDDAALSSLFDAMMDDLYDGDYAGAITVFAKQCDTLLAEYREGARFDVGSHILLSLLIGFVLALIVVTSMKGQLKSVQMQKNATNYMQKDSLHISDSHEVFLYHTVRKVRRQSDGGQRGGSGASTTHRSSSGRTHGGGSRSFR